MEATVGRWVVVVVVVVVRRVVVVVFGVVVVSIDLRGSLGRANGSDGRG